METWLAILLLMVLGFILLLIELFVIPGFGLTGIAGLGAFGYASFLAFTEFEASWPGWMSLLVSIALVAIFIVFFPRTKVWKKLRLNTREGSEDGFQSHSREKEELVGKSGVTLTMLRPAGTARIEGKRVDVVTEGTFIPKDTHIKVVLVEGSRVVVRKVNANLTEGGKR